jgi:hypothetical protein
MRISTHNFLFFIIILVIFSVSCGEFEFYEIIRDNLNNLLQQKVLNSTTDNISPQCREAFYNSYLHPNHTDFYYYKLIKDSSKNKNDVGSYNDCLLNRYRWFNTEHIDNFTYLIVNIKRENSDNKTDINFEEGMYMFGLCTVKGCHNDDYQEIIFQVDNNIGKVLNLSNKNDTTITNVEGYSKMVYDKGICNTLFRLSPFLVFFIQFLFMIFPSVPVNLFRCFFKKREISNVNESNTNTNTLTITHTNTSLTGNNTEYNIPKIPRKSLIFNKSLLYKFKSAFNITSNGEELLTPIQTELNNDTGMAYMRGVKGLNMLILISGFVFYNLYNSNLKIYESLSYINFLKSYFVMIIFFGLRYSPRILFSCSGFSFVYKYLSYLDSRAGLDTGEEKENYYNYTKYEKNENEKYLYQYKSHYKKDVNISNIYLFKFLFRQFYKYFMHLLMVLFFRYSFYYIFSFLSSSGPMSVFFKNNLIDRMNSNQVLGHLLLYASYDFYHQTTPLNIFWMSLNEISFFISSCIIVFICYKKNLRMDIFFIFIFIGLILLRLSVYFVKQNLFSSLFYYYEDYGYLFINPLYNFTFFIIGIFFGMINYTIQNSIGKKDAIGLKKNYLITATYVSQAFSDKSRKKYFLIIVFGFVIVFLCAFFIQISLQFYSNEPEKFNQFFIDNKVNLFLLIDTEIVVVFIHIISLCFFLMGPNHIMKFLSNSYWLIKSRIYFSYILIMNPIILYVFYHSESRIKIDFFTVTFFSVIIYVVVLCLANFMYVFVELPWKRINKIILRDSEE